MDLTILHWPTVEQNIIKICGQINSKKNPHHLPWQITVWLYIHKNIMIDSWSSIKCTQSHSFTKILTCEMLVWLANIRPLTLCDVWMYGDFRDRATWMLAGPHGMNWASLRSLILCRLLCTWHENEMRYRKGMNTSYRNWKSYRL